jgi:hypothetical protein
MTPESFTRWREALGGRRFLLTLGCGVACTLLRYTGNLDDGSFTAVVIATVGAYITGGTFEKVKAAKEA